MKTDEKLFKLFYSLVDEIKEHDVVQVTTPSLPLSPKHNIMAFGARKLSSPSSSSSGDKNLKHTNDKIGNSKLSASSTKGRGSVGRIKRKVNTRSVSRSLSVS